MIYKKIFLFRTFNPLSAYYTYYISQFPDLHMPFVVTPDNSPSLLQLTTTYYKPLFFLTNLLNCKIIRDFRNVVSSKHFHNNFFRCFLIFKCPPIIVIS